MNKTTTKHQIRTLTQNRAIHKYLELVARELQNQGQTLQNVVGKIDQIEIIPTTHTLKEALWKPLQEVALGKRSTTQLETNEVRQVYEMVAMFLSKQFEIDLPFPSQENTDSYITSLEQTNDNSETTHTP